MQFHQLAGVVLVDAAAGPEFFGDLLHRFVLLALHAFAALADTAAGKPSAQAAFLFVGLQAGVHRRGDAFGRGRLRVVEVEQHRRMFGRSAEHLAERAEHVGADGVAFVGQHVGARLVVLQGHVEMVEPEVGQHLGQLILAVGGTQHLLPDEFGDEFALGSQVVVVHILADRPPPLALLHALQCFARHAAVAGRHAQHEERRRVRLGDLGRRQVERLERSQLLLKRFIRKIGVQLPVEPRLQAHLDDPVDVAGARAVGEAAQQVRRRLAVGQSGLGVGQGVEPRRWGVVGRRDPQEGAAGEQEGCQEEESSFHTARRGLVRARPFSGHLFHKTESPPPSCHGNVVKCSRFAG